MNKKKDFIFDVIKNLIAFGIYIFAMQILFLPFMSRFLDDSVNASLLTFMVIFNLLTASLGQELAIAFQINMGKEIDSDNLKDFKWLLVASNILIFVVTCVVLGVLKYGIVTILALGLVSVLTNNRFYYFGHFRRNKEFQLITYSNVWYFAGMLIGLAFCYFVSMTYWVPLLLAEIFANIATYFKLKDVYFIKAERTPKFKRTLKEYWDLGFSTLLTNVPQYADKLLVLPLLGERNMAVYYAGTTLSKILFLLVNPINGVLLSWLASSTSTNPRAMVNKYIKFNVVLVVGIFIVSIPFTYVSSWILYNHFLIEITELIIPISLASAFLIGVSLLRVMFLNYFQTRYITIINTINIVGFLVFGTLGAKYYGMLGFAYGLAISRLIHWADYILFMVFSKMRKID